MSRVVKPEVLEFIIPCGTNNWIILRELGQDVFELFMMQNTGITPVNVAKDVRRKGIKIRSNFWRTECFSRASGNFKVGRVLALEEGRPSWYIYYTPYIQDIDCIT